MVGSDSILSVGGSGDGPSSDAVLENNGLVCSARPTHCSAPRTGAVRRACKTCPVSRAVTEEGK